MPVLIMSVERFERRNSMTRRWFDVGRRLTHRNALLLMISIGALCRIAFVFGTPIFYAPDEQSHFKYIEYLCDHHSFPIQTSQTGALSNDWEYYQPPLYYLAMQPIYSAAAAAFSTEAAIVRTIRCASVALWLLTVWLAARFLRSAAITDEAVNRSTMAVMCLLPTYTFLSSVINNDNLLIAIGGGVFCLLAQRTYSLTYVFSLGILLGLAMLTKLNAIVYLLACVLSVCFDALAMRTRWRSIVLRGGLILGIATAIWFPWGLRNWQTYGSMTAEHIANIRKIWDSWGEAIAYIVRSLLRTFWSVSGIFNDVYGNFPLIGLLLSGISLIGLIKIRRQPELARQWLPDTSLRLWRIFALTLLAHLALVFRFGILYRQAQGRFLFPMLLPLAMFFSCGIRAIMSKDAGNHLMLLFIGYATTFTMFSLLIFFRIA